MNNKHTPGPWNTSRADGLRIDDSKGTQIASAVSLDYYAPALAVQQANARLIAAAPDLLYALECIVQSWPAHGTGVNNPMADAMAAKAHAALAKAMQS